MSLRIFARPLPLFWAAAIALAVLVVYGTSLWNGFVDWDDPQLLLENPLVKSFSPRIFFSYDPELYVPLTLFTFQVEHLLFELQPFFYHFDALLLHIANAALVLWFLSMMIKNRWLAFAGALVFALHPVNVEAVAWVSARKELLWAMFFLLTLIAYEKGAEGDRRWKTWSLVFFLLALLSKPTALMAPFVLLLLDWRRGERLDGQSFISKWHYFLLAAAAAVIAVIGRSNGLAGLSTGETLLLAFRSTTFYVEKFFVPLHLSAIYAAPSTISVADPSIALSIVTLVILAGILWLLRQWDRNVLVGAGIFLLMLLPTFLAYQKADDVTLAADRYAYVPFIGLLLVIVTHANEFAYRLAVSRRFKSAANGANDSEFIPWVFTLSPPLPELAHLRERTVKTAVASMIVVACGFGFLAHAQSLVWRDSQSLFTHVLQEDHDSHIAISNLGSLALDRGNVEEAIRLSSDAVRLKPTYADAYVNLGAAYGRQKDYARAEEVLRQAIMLNPEHPQAYFNLGGIEQMRGNLENAATMYSKAIEFKPAHADAYFQLARVRVRQGKRDDARAAYRSAVEINPGLRGVSAELDALGLE